MDGIDAIVGPCPTYKIGARGPARYLSPVERGWKYGLIARATRRERRTAARRRFTGLASGTHAP